MTCIVILMSFQTITSAMILGSQEQIHRVLTRDVLKLFKLKIYLKNSTKIVVKYLLVLTGHRL